MQTVRMSSADAFLPERGACNHGCDEARALAHHEAASSHMPTAVLAAERLNSLAKPPGSLGTLEEWAATLCTVQGTLTPAAAPQTVLVFCAYPM